MTNNKYLVFKFYQTVFILFVSIGLFTSNQAMARNLTVAAISSFGHEYNESNSTKIAKFNKAVAKEIGSRLGAKVNIKTVQSHFMDLGSDVDFTVGDIPFDTNSYEISGFYGYLPAVFAIHTKNKSIYKLDDLNGKKLGACSGCIYEDYLDGKLNIPGPLNVKVDKYVRAHTMRDYGSTRSAIEDLLVGDGVYLHGVVAAKMAIDQAIKKGEPMRIIGQPVFHTPLGVSVSSRSRDLANQISSVIEGMKRTGQFSQLSSKWVGSDISSSR